MSRVDRKALALALSLAATAASLLLGLGLGFADKLPGWLQTAIMLSFIGMLAGFMAWVLYGFFSTAFRRGR